MKKKIIMGVIGCTLVIGIFTPFALNKISYPFTEEIAGEYTLTTGFLKADGSEIYLSNNPLPIYRSEDTYYNIELKNPDEYVYTNTMYPSMVRGTLKNDTITDSEVFELDDTRWEESKYLKAYTYLLETGAIQAIQKYTSLAIGLINFPNDEIMRADFESIKDVDIDFMHLTEIDKEDDLLVSLAINCTNLFEEQDVHVAESVTNQMKELISKLETFEK